jgi:hypothetical protein
VSSFLLLIRAGRAHDFSIFFAPVNVPKSGIY